MIGGLVVTHGDFGEVLVKETRRLIGDVENLAFLSIDAMSAKEMTSSIQEAIGNDPWIVFADSPGTSPAVRGQAAIGENQAVITGINLAILMSFVMKRETMEFQELVEQLVIDGHRSIGAKWAKEKNR